MLSTMFSQMTLPLLYNSYCVIFVSV